MLTKNVAQAADHIVLQFETLFQSPITQAYTFGNVARIASIRSVGSGMAHKKSLKGNVEHPYQHDSAPYHAIQPTTATADPSEDDPIDVAKEDDLAHTPSVTAPLRITSGKKRSRTLSRSDTLSSSSSLGSPVLLSTPTTPLRSRNASIRLQGDMRDELDYLYDNFALDEDTPNIGRPNVMGGEGGGNGDLASPWQLILPSPSSRRMYEGMAVDEGWVWPPSPTKVRGGRLRRMQTLGSLRD